MSNNLPPHNGSHKLYLHGNVLFQNATRYKEDTLVAQEAEDSYNHKQH